MVLEMVLRAGRRQGEGLGVRRIARWPVADHDFLLVLVVGRILILIVVLIAVLVAVPVLVAVLVAVLIAVRVALPVAVLLLAAAVSIAAVVARMRFRDAGGMGDGACRRRGVAESADERERHQGATGQCSGKG